MASFCLLRKSNLWLIVFILIPLYFVSLVRVFRLENKKHLNASIDEVQHLDDRLSSFKQTKNKRQRNIDRGQHQEPTSIILGNNVSDEVDIVLRRDDDDDGMLKKERKYNDTTTKIVDHHHRRRREKLQIKLDRIAYENNKPNDYIPLWELSDYVPQWMKEYFDWHTEKRRTLNPEDIISPRNSNSNNNNNNNNNTSTTRFLIVQCLHSNQDTNNECGSISERLMILPYLLRIAYETKRILFIHWDIPVDITYFLLPPMMGFDFRAPMWLRRIVSKVVCFCVPTFISFFISFSD
jgi:hypothetical protein